MPTVKPKAPVTRVVVKTKTKFVDDKALASATKKLEAERNAYSKKNGGKWPTDRQLMNSRKGM